MSISVINKQSTPSHGFFNNAKLLRIWDTNAHAAALVLALTSEIVEQRAYAVTIRGAGRWVSCRGSP